MSVPFSAPEIPPRAARAPHTAPVVASSACLVCGAPMAERKGKQVCSGKCRAALSRRRRAEALRTRDQEIRAGLEGVIRLAQRLVVRLGGTTP